MLQSSRPIVFMMHIAKTAGSYLNQVFLNALGQDRVALHVERFIGDHETFLKTIDKGITFFSGHIYLANIENIIELAGKRAETKIITVVRDPLEQLASHIKWFDHYNLPENEIARGRLPETVQELIAKIKKTDLDDAGSLDRFLTFLDATGIQYLDNCQSRYFLASKDSNIQAETPITLDTRRRLGKRIEVFDMVLRGNKLREDIAALAELLNIDLQYLDERVNVAKSNRSLDYSNPLTRSVLSKRLVVDNWMWNRLQS